MRLAYGGHPSWFVMEGRNCIAVSPFLKSAVGGWSLYPPRALDVHSLNVGAIILPDGFWPNVDLDSIAQLPKQAPIFLGPLSGMPVERALRDQGRSVPWHGDSR
jgi:hypothetical protein